MKKVITKALNVLVVILVAIGIYSIVMYFVKVKPLNEDYNEVLQKNSKLELQINQDMDKISNLEYQVFERDEIISQRESTISNLKDENERIIAETNKKIEELKDQSLEEIIELIKSIYGITDASIEIKTIEGQILVVFTPDITRRVANDLVRLESANIRLKTALNTVSEYESLVNDYICKVELLESKDSLKTNIINAEREKNSNFQELLDNRNKMIKSLKVQRNAAGIIIGVVIVLAIL
jgi:hypothetical protein